MAGNYQPKAKVHVCEMQLVRGTLNNIHLRRVS
ncbi:hypothetical protein FOQG_02786 [Fusarium oxysporum f. sp. raphani 54005]|uniref:Uncharacterized protein n=3 Tax=Fusarium oxysporum TaxID=5507 RepID=X0D2A8_FUSOX|nr:hypothetical protein FOVG_07828 [Fusarium oxysporum f. sp. pisi HDV247]EXK97668.1 hypothetical protein FOQG_02786 [Fusarium oxysporum f. sp. raphani 54005]EXL74321.1 hypothetical protein FOPG_10492 [Fusarium oxysporum f. sp. conglutinans race 2 54008]